MKQIRVARRYAKALIGLAREQNQLDRITDDLRMLERTMRESREFVVFMKSPIIPSQKKKRVLEDLFGGKIHPTTQAFVTLLAEKGREDCLDDILTECFALRDAALGIVNVSVRSAASLSPAQSDVLQKRFEGITNKKVRLQFSLDAALRGGFVARVGDTVYDGSVRRQLELLRDRFAHGAAMN